jgi:hypothetical protein
LQRNEPHASSSNLRFQCSRKRSFSGFSLLCRAITAE